LETEKGTSTLGQRLHRSTQEHDDGWLGKTWSGWWDGGL
jgi:hypothetical protein